MTHEFKKIIAAFHKAEKEGIAAVLATVVALDGSSYRRPGVRMLLLSNGNMVGAVSGGCVEKEVQRQAETVFNAGTSKVMTYDGRYRLGCEGVLYLLLEPFNPSSFFIEEFDTAIANRTNFKITSFYQKEERSDIAYGSTAIFENGNTYSFNYKNKRKTNIVTATFVQQMSPCFKLVIIGAEHDAVQLCLYASLNGWEVTVIAAPNSAKTIGNFPGAKALLTFSAKELTTVKMDKQTAVVLMTHNFANDLNYLVGLKDKNLVYIGLLGPVKRRKKLISQLLEYSPELKDSFLDKIHGPAGINIGAETPQEIAVSIIAEILTVIRNQEPMKLSDKKKSIHA